MRVFLTYFAILSAILGSIKYVLHGTLTPELWTIGLVAYSVFLVWKKSIKVNIISTIISLYSFAGTIETQSPQEKVILYVIILALAMSFWGIYIMFLGLKK